MHSGLVNWHYVCPCCKYEKADLALNINSLNSHEVIDEDSRALGLASLRKINFRTLLTKIKSYKDSGRLLDVGCAHGWFLDVADETFRVSGIEPDYMISNSKKLRGFDIKQGYFPNILDSNDKYDLITFNDVFEHIPNISLVLDACKNHLEDDGILIINLPSSSGIFYKTAKFFYRFGIMGFFDRLWQKDLPSPHLHYFNSSNLNDLLSKHGFIIKENGNLSSLVFNGLYTRIMFARNISILKASFVYVCTLLLIPVLSFLPADISYVIASKNK